MFSLPMTGWKAIEDRKEKVAMIELAYHTLQATPFISHFLKSPPSNFCGPGAGAVRPDQIPVPFYLRGLDILIRHSIKYRSNTTHFNRCDTV